MSDLFSAKQRVTGIVIISIGFGLLFLYLLWSTLNGGISIPTPKGDGTIDINGRAAWMACVSPLFIIAGTVIGFRPQSQMSANAQHFWYVALSLIGAALFVVAVLVGK